MKMDNPGAEHVVNQPGETMVTRTVTSGDGTTQETTQVTTVMTTADIETQPQDDQNTQHASAETRTVVTRVIKKTITTSESGVTEAPDQPPEEPPVAVPREAVTVETTDLAPVQNFHAAICQDKAEEADALLKAGVNVNEKFPEGIDQEHTGLTPLALACALNKVNTVKVLLENGADVNDTFASLNTSALMTSSYHGHSEVVRLLIAYGANVNALDLQQSTALGYSFGGTRNMDVIQQLISAGVDVNQKNMLGMNALLLVAGYGNEELVKTVLEAGGDPMSSNDFGHNALYMAVTGKRQLLQSIQQSAVAMGTEMTPDVLEREWLRVRRAYPTEIETCDVLVKKAEQTMISIGKHLAPTAASVANDPQAMVETRIDALERHRKDKAKEKTKVKRSGSFLNTLLSCGGGRSKKAAQGTDESLPYGAKPSQANAQPLTEHEGILIRSCGNIMNMLINSGCRVDMPDRIQNVTALDLAILHGDADSTVLLVSAGGDPNHIHKLMATTDLYQAIYFQDRKAMRDLMADEDLDANKAFCRFNVVDPRQTDKVVNEADIGITPLTLAARMDDQESAKMLLKRGASVDFIGPSGNFPLAEAAARGNRKMVELLCSHNASIDLPCEAYEGATPVAIAAMVGNKPIVSYLIWKSAKVDLPMHNGRTALLNAFEAKNNEIIECLLEADLNMNIANKEGLHFQLAQMYQSKEKDVEAILTLGAEALRQGNINVIHEAYPSEPVDPNANMGYPPKATAEETDGANGAVAQQQQTVAPSDVNVAVNQPSHDPAGQTSV